MNWHLPTRRLVGDRFVFVPPRVVIRGEKGQKGSERIVFQNDDEEAIADLRKGRIVAREAGEVIARLKKVTRGKPIIGE